MKHLRFLMENECYEGIVRGEEVIYQKPCSEPASIHISDIHLLPPATPSKIVCVGLNYKDHALELGMEIPQEPIIFIKPSTSVIGPGESIVYPDTSNRVDYEAELAIVIKNTAKDVPAKKALDHILGYTCINDVTARDLQKKDGQWTRAKSFDTFAPLGPWIETDLDTSDLAVRSYLNGEVKQDSRTSEFIFKVPYLIEFISSIMTLYPHDVIATGTPTGVGPISRGDEVSVEIEGVGKLTNIVK